MIIINEKRNSLYDDLLTLLSRAEDGKLINNVHSLDKSKIGKTVKNIVFDYPDYDNKNNEVRVMVEIEDDGRIKITAPEDLKNNITQLIVDEYPYYKKNII